MMKLIYNDTEMIVRLGELDKCKFIWVKNVGNLFGTTRDALFQLYAFIPSSDLIIQYRVIACEAFLSKPVFHQLRSRLVSTEA